MKLLKTVNIEKKNEKVLSLIHSEAQNPNSENGVKKNGVKKKPTESTKLCWGYKTKSLDFKCQQKRGRELRRNILSSVAISSWALGSIICVFLVNQERLWPKEIRINFSSQRK